MIACKHYLVWVLLGLSIPVITPVLLEGREHDSQTPILQPKILFLQLLDKNILGIGIRFEDSKKTIHPIGTYKFTEIRINTHPISWWQVQSQTYENRINIGITHGVLALLEANAQNLPQSLIRGAPKKKNTPLADIRRFMFFNGEIHIKTKNQFSSNLHHFPVRPQFNTAQILGNSQSLTASKTIVHNYFANMKAHIEETLLMVPLSEEIETQKELTIILKGHSPLANQTTSFVTQQSLILSEVDRVFLSQIKGLPSSDFYRDLWDIKKSYSEKKYALVAQRGSTRLKEDPEVFNSESIPGRAEWIFLTADSLSRIGQIKKARQLFAKVVEGYPYTSFASDSRLWLSKQNFKTLIQLGE